MPFDSRYSPSDVITYLNRIPNLKGKKKYLTAGNTEAFSYYENESTIVLSPSTDTETQKAQMLQTISQGFKRLPDDLPRNKKILIPITEEQKIIWLFKRNHWVTLHYNPSLNQATVLDSRPWFISFFYPMNAIKNELKKGISHLYGDTKANQMTFTVEYQNVQYNDTYCGAWTCRNIFDLSNTASQSIDDQKKKYSSQDEQRIIQENKAMSSTVKGSSTANPPRVADKKVRPEQKIPIYSGLDLKLSDNSLFTPKKNQQDCFSSNSKEKAPEEPSHSF